MTQENIRALLDPQPTEPCQEMTPCPPSSWAVCLQLSPGGNPCVTGLRMMNRDIPDECVFHYVEITKL